MKIQINYDLLSKIMESKTGFSLQRLTNKVMLCTSISSSFCIPITISRSGTTEEILNGIVSLLFWHTCWESIGQSFNSKYYKNIAINELKRLVSILNDINVSTNYELLLQSYTYKTNYKIKFNKYFLPCLKQDKYIMVPIYNNGEEKEISLIQEHIIGSKEYELSCGSQTKLLKL